MNRELKFRVWDHISKTLTKSLNIGGTSVALCLHNQGLVMQYTGLKDKNGTEIYEGDVVQEKIENTCVECERPHEVEYNYYKVIFEDGCFLIKNKAEQTYGLRSTKEFIEVVGNIYENPELLEN